MVTTIQKAEADRTAIETTISTLELVLTDHAIAPLGEASATSFLQMASDAKDRLLDNLNSILQCRPADPVPYQTEFSSMLRRVVSVHSGLHGIKMSFPPPVPVNHGSPAHHQEVKLPTLQIPNFNGDLQQWISFRDMFTATVHNKTSISKIEKLSYLKSLVHGEASRQIQDIILSESNYDLAWQALCDRYNNDRELLFSVSAKLFNQQVISNATALNIRQLMDTTKSCIRSLDILRIKTNECRALILYLVFSKLDNATKESWLQSLPSKDVPDLDDLFSFLEQRAAAVPATSSSQGGSKQRINNNPQRAQAHHVQSAHKCSSGCKDNHKLYHCDKFLKLQTKQKIDHLVKNRFCFNCLGQGHSAKYCKSNGACKTCNKRHNTLIHMDQPQTHVANGGSVDSQSVSCYTNYNGRIPQSFLATAIVKVNTIYGPVCARVLLDSCSSNSIICEAFAKKWKLEVSPAAVEVLGLASTSIGNAVGMTNIDISPHFRTDIQFSITALVMPTISGKQPPTKLQHGNWTHLENLELADPTYYQPSGVDILIGGDVFWSLLKFASWDKITGKTTDPFAVNSMFGWLVVGPLNNIKPVKVITMITNVQLHQQMEKFWQDESLPDIRDERSKEENACEDIFQQTTSRLQDGRFIVSIPWKQNKGDIGETRSMAVQRLKYLERRFTTAKCSQYKSQYIKFMREYIDLGHMTEVSSSNDKLTAVPLCYIPHHFVLKLESTTTKLRVVFDGSAKSSSGISLNDLMMVGPVVQPSLYDIIMRFRLFPIAFTSDIEKMYRQIYLSEKDRDMHRIVWREDSSDDIKEYKLNTVTYGTASAPYLATRALYQLAEEVKVSHPTASNLIQTSTYVDDLMACSEIVESAQTAITELISVGESAQLSFRKWSCNNAEVLESIPEEIRETKTLIPMEEDIIVKTLGIFWNPVQDVYQFKINLPESKPVDTKRIVLSDMSKLFDPLGWLAPVTIKAKIIMQDIWKQNIGWDTAIPPEIEHQWNEYKLALNHLECLKIPRHFPYVECESVHLVGFSDSLKATAAVIYLYGITSTGEVHTCLLTAKTKVASINSPTLPRLELNAAVLLAELIAAVVPVLKIKLNSIQAFTDSTIVLAWILSDANRWKMYVKNRVLKIQRLLPATMWAHVKGTENPADCASRGINGNEIIHHNLWWTGNKGVFQSQPIDKKNNAEYDFSVVKNEERKDTATSAHVVVNTLPFLSMFSSFRKLVIFTVVVMRLQRYVKSGKKDMRRGIATVDELECAKVEILKCVQACSFSSELKLLCKSDQQQLPKQNQLLNLNPFVDSKGLLRVGGRLRHARLRVDHRNPILLSKSHHVTKLIITDIHLKNFHCGAQQTLAILNQQFWVVRGRDTVRYVLKQCVVCRRHRADLLSQKMGDLPEARVNPARAFLKTGVDFAGPFVVRNYGRSKIMQKVYLSVFICLVTKALHIEVVSSLSTDAFLAAFRRFIFRRGRPTDVYSDCGTNFVGADRELRELFALQHKDKDQIITHAAKDGVVWHFNPPGAPHMGGLWEAGVKSIKYHLRRVLSSHHLTYEEFNTLIIQIEGILNSRPLTALSTDPNDLRPLTPGHFLIGEPIVGLPEHDYSDVKVGRLDRWQLLQLFFLAEMVYRVHNQDATTTKVDAAAEVN